MVAPKSIVATFDEATKVLLILKRKRWGEIMDLARADIGAFKAWFDNNPNTPEDEVLVKFQREGQTSQEADKRH